uniref:Aspartyl/asparaginyl beta-hydroxylase isoform X6 n=1 Tax=Phascolarctos cinereus TaxID=38626 RepID=A0A6P5LP95_PHACI|nr:aspartyl/asparaginyl beta-hydroxylase isoform X6 [Phascolarctos cinereus]
MNEDKEAKHGGHKNGKKEGLSGSSFFTWFMVIALLGVWTSVAVVWFDLVDYEEVLAKAKDFRYNLSEVLQGKLGIYDADDDGDFDVDDAKVLLGLTKDGSNENIDSLEEVLNILAEESSDWFYGFLSFLYDVMTPFEILEEEESETAGDVDGLKEKSASAKSILPGQPEDHIQPEDQATRKSEHQNVENEVEEDIQFVLKEALQTQHENDKEEEAVEAVEEQQIENEEEDIPMRNELEDKLEDLVTETLHEETEDRYYQTEGPESDSNEYNKDVEEIVYKQENPDYQEIIEPGVKDTIPEYDTEDTPYQHYDEQVYEPPENERTEAVSDIAVEDLNVGVEEGNISPVEEQHEIPSETIVKTNDPEQKEKESEPDLEGVSEAT